MHIDVFVLINIYIYSVICMTKDEEYDCFVELWPTLSESIETIYIILIPISSSNGGCVLGPSVNRREISEQY